MKSPLMMSALAVLRPTRRGNRCVPPPPGSSPSLHSGKPNFAGSEATTMSAMRDELEAAAQGKPIDGRDHRLGERLPAVIHSPAETLKVDILGHGDADVLVNVGSRDECSATPGQDNDPDLWIAFQFVRDDD